MNDQAVLAHDTNCELFTRKECEEILKAGISGLGKCYKLIDFEVTPELGTIGYLGEYFHLRMSYQLENDEAIRKTRFFVKSIPYKNADMTSFIEKSGILKKESTLYKTLLNELRKLSKTRWCSECYLTRSDLFVMQNITDLGYEPLKDSTSYLKEPQVKVLLKGLAAMHASSVVYERKYNVNIGEQLKDVLYEVTVLPTVEWYTAGIRAVLAVARGHPLYQEQKLQEFIEKKLPACLDSVYEMVNPSQKYPNVFCHRDPWGGNVFFHGSHPNEVASVFVDFQLCRYSPAAIDVLMALNLNMRPKDRKLIQRDCCLHYFEQLVAELFSMGVEANDYMTLAEFEHSLVDFALFGALYNCISATILRVPGDYLKEMKLNRPEDFHRYTNVDRTKEVLELVQLDKEFRDYMYECIEDLMELVLK